MFQPFPSVSLARSRAPTLGHLHRRFIGDGLPSQPDVITFRPAFTPKEFAMHLARSMLPFMLPVVALSCMSPPDAATEMVRISSAATVSASFVDEVYATGLTNPTAMAFAGDGRLFVCQQGGQLRVIKNGALLAAPFVTVTVSSAGERGLLGIAFDPGFASNGFVYVYYTATTPAIHNRVSRFTAAGDVAVAGSEVELLNLENLSTATNHNGGSVHFGPDGKLYVAVGENANGANAQSLNTRLGKILRINTDGTIPGDNPFLGITTGLNRAVWAMGVRNPFTFTFQRGTGRMFIDDVGEVTWEEIDDGIAGSNYGWPTSEGPTTDARFRAPLFAYQHGSSTTTGCAITGGAFYNPSIASFPASFTGKYFFADFCSGWIRLFDPAAGTATDFASGVSSPVDLQVLDTDGALYYLARGNGTVGRIRAATPNQAPQITTQPQSQIRSVGQMVTFSVNATGTAPLAFQWQRNGATIAGASAATFTIAAVAAPDDGATFGVIVSNPAGTVTSALATLTVTGNLPPVPTITAPVANMLYDGGQVVTFAGSASDPEGGMLLPSDLTWRIDFHHDTHLHPFLADTSGIGGGTFTVPTRGETSTNVFFRIHLTARDAAGLTAETFVDLRPRVSTLSLATTPAGLQVTLDGQPIATPAAVPSVAGTIRAVGAPSPQTSGGTAFSFVSWSDGGAGTHDITVPAASAALTATYGGAVSATFVSTLVALHSSQCLDVPGSTTATGARLIQWTCHGGLNQSFELQPVAGVADTFFIRSRSSSLCVNVRRRSTADGGQIIQSTCGNVTNEQFTLVPVTDFGGSKDFMLRAVHSSKCVMVPGSSMTTGTQLAQATCVPTQRNFVWRLAGRP
jgi:glucose/arabinose dehydrogenase